MAAKLMELNSLDKLKDVMAQSANTPQLLFKHSLTCPISADAYDELQSYLNTTNEPIGHWLIVVQTDREISNQAAADLDVEHESPQAILVRNGKAVWHTSHRRITVDSLTNAIRNNAA